MPLLGDSHIYFKLSVVLVNTIISGSNKKSRFLKKFGIYTPNIYDGPKSNLLTRWKMLFLYE